MTSSIFNAPTGKVNKYLIWKLSLGKIWNQNGSVMLPKSHFTKVRGLPFQYFFVWVYSLYVQNDKIVFPYNLSVEEECGFKLSQPIECE